VPFWEKLELICANFKLILNKLPRFPIEPFSVIKITVAQTDFAWYSGIVNYPDNIGTKQDFYVFSGNGFITYLSKLSAEGIYPPSDVGEIVDYITQNEIIPFSPIKYNPAKINTETGVITANDIEFGKSKINAVLDTLADMAGHNWGVDGDQDLYFEPITEEIQKTYFIGNQLNNFKPKLNLEKVRNSILVLREKGLAEGGSGWVVAGVYNDESSQKKYKKRELEIQVPGFFEQEEVDIIGNASLNEKKDPKPSGTFSGIDIKSGDDWLPRGNYRIILPHGDFDFIYSDVDDPNEWDEYISGDLIVSKEENIFVYGDGCIKLNYSNAENDRIELLNPIREKIQKIRVFLRANKTGSFLKIGFGKTNWNENIFNIDLPVKDVFYNLDWDISKLNIDEINKIGFQITEGETNPTDLYIDKIEMNAIGNKFYKLPLETVTYKFIKSDQSASGEFGILPPKMEDFLSGLFKTVNELKYVSESK